MLVDRLNSAQQAAEKSSPGGKVTTDGLKTLADVLDELAKDIGAMSITTPELRSYADEYGKKAGEAAAAARIVAARVEAGKLDEAKAAKQKLDRIHASERWSTRSTRSAPRPEQAVIEHRATNFARLARVRYPSRHTGSR